jgi:hypothetical protein
VREVSESGEGKEVMVSDSLPGVELRKEKKTKNEIGMLNENRSSGVHCHARSDQGMHGIAVCGRVEVDVRLANESKRLHAR